MLLHHIATRSVSFTGPVNDVTISTNAAIYLSTSKIDTYLIEMGAYLTALQTYTVRDLYTYAYPIQKHWTLIVYPIPIYYATIITSSPVSMNTMWESLLAEHIEVGTVFSVVVISPRILNNTPSQTASKTTTDQRILYRAHDAHTEGLTWNTVSSYIIEPYINADVNTDTVDMHIVRCAALIEYCIYIYTYVLIG